MASPVHLPMKDGFLSTTVRILPVIILRNLVKVRSGKIGKSLLRHTSSHTNCCYSFDRFTTNPVADLWERRLCQRLL